LENRDPLPQKEHPFVSKIWMAAGIVTLIIVALMLSWKANQVFLYTLAGAIIAIYFHGFAGLIARKTKVSQKWSLILSIVLSVSFLFGAFFLIGARVTGEAVQFSKEVPGLVEDAKNFIETNSTMKFIYEKVSSSKLVEKASPILSGLFNTTMGVFGDIYIVLFIGIFFTAAPNEYKAGIVRLLPADARAKGRDLIAEISKNLRAWLKGMLFSMLVVFALTSIGLAILGIDLWLVLALIAGLLSFIPNFGPIISIVPAALVALSQSPITALWVILLYCFVQLVESNFITPLVQQELIKTPPALIIISQVFVGIWLGAWGVILATPILVIVMVLVEELYIKKQDQKQLLSNP
jgi:predicted PurR-regulated permease PerM